jgi:glycosyltransferase involved in cell wall biosynthesis
VTRTTPPAPPNGHPARGPSRQAPGTGTVLVDIAGAQMGGAARWAGELHGYLARTGRADVRVAGAGRSLGPAWLLRREGSGFRAARRIATNNVSFAGPGGERWVLLRNALHFVTGPEAARLDPVLRASVRREAAVVRLAARRADVLVVPSSAMAARVVQALPWAASRITVRPHPVSVAADDTADQAGNQASDQAGMVPPAGSPVILCPVLFAPYKGMVTRLADLLAALADCGDDGVRVRLTAHPADLPRRLAADPRLDCLGRLDQAALRAEWARCRAVYFPTGLESFGYPLAEARVAGRPVIALDTEQNREIAGTALRGFAAGQPDSLRHAVQAALSTGVTPDPGPFDPGAYFGWLLGTTS